MGVFKPVDISWNECSPESILRDTGLHLEAFRFEFSLEEKNQNKFTVLLKQGLVRCWLPLILVSCIWESQKWL